jgi:tryptophan-rich sensory protein
MKKYLNYILTIIGFTLLNFTGLALGSLWTDSGVNSDWYTNIIKAPWTPPGFVFGLVWTTIMIFFSVFMANLYERRNSNYTQLLFISWILNISWNPLFFTLNWVWISSVVIVLLTVLLGYLIHQSRKEYKWMWLLLVPYFLWLNIATSLNLFVAIMN